MTETQQRKPLSHKIFTVRDTKVNAFDSRLLVQKTTDEALRTFQSIAQDQNTMVGKYPNDFALFELGEFDDASGSFFIHPAPINLGLAAQWSKPNGNVSNLKEAN